MYMYGSKKKEKDGKGKREACEGMGCRKRMDTIKMKGRKDLQENGKKRKKGKGKNGKE